MAYRREITLISGLRDAGKTNLCLELIRRLNQTERTIKGIVSPGLYKDGKKIGIMARDVATGEERQFAKYSVGWDVQRPEREWRFLNGGIEWANMRLKQAVPTDILFIDEIGYLEMEENGGWTAAPENLDTGLFQHAIVVIRPDLLDNARERWMVNRVILVKEEDNPVNLTEKIMPYLADNE